ncbi:MAG TPA: ABC transporter permease [Solirubrobacteraceae bacterium]|nr:ABC transporter permease [Solirubrobacteraceae bacterium]
MLALRWLLGKDLRILRRSPVLSALLIFYPAVVAVLIGLALSRSPGLPRVAFLNEIAPSRSEISLGATRIDINSYEKQLFHSLALVPVKTRAQALADVRDGTTVAALIIPADLPQRLATGDETAFINVVYNGSAINESLVQSAIEAKLGRANALLAAQLEKVAAGYINLLLGGGKLSFLGETFNVLGLRASERRLDAVLAALPANSPVYPRIASVANFAKIAVNNLGTSKRVIGAVAAPVRARNQFVNGRRTALDFYAVAVAVTVSLMFVCLLLASGMLALEREENTFGRLRRGLVRAEILLAEKALLAAVCAAVVGFAMLAGISIFVTLDWARAGLWLVAIAGGSIAFATLGVALGGLVRDVRAASLLALLVSFPLVFLALVPAGAVAPGLYDVIRVLSAVFPFKPAFEAVNAAVNRSSPGVWVAIGHLAALVAGFGALARVGLRG